MLKVSFIIPIHNLGELLIKCFNSLVIQDILSDSEVILIDDGSTDDSKNICMLYTRKYPCFKYYYINNGGVSLARNYGILKSSGKYICFLDGDDYYSINFASIFYEMCEANDLDFIRGRYQVLDEKTGNQLSYKTRINCFNKVMTGLDFLVSTISKKANEVVPWLGFFKRDFLLSNSIFFPEGIAYEEDHIFFLKCLLFAKKSTIVNNTFYVYRYRDNSASKTFSLKKAIDVLDVVEKELNLLQYVASYKYKKYVYKYLSSSFYQLTSIYGRISKDERKIIRNAVKARGFSLMTFKSFADLHQHMKIIFFFLFPHILSFLYDLVK